jgi:hypothetical protein
MFVYIGEMNLDEKVSSLVISIKQEKINSKQRHYLSNLDLISYIFEFNISSY